MNTKFYNLSQKKQDTVINAAIEIFSQSTYKRSSTEDIAKQAGISKGLLFHYFQNKKTLYLFLYQYCLDLMVGEILAAEKIKEEDFFQLMIELQNCKLEIIKRYPSLFQFLIKAYYEKDEEIAKEIQRRNQEIGKTSLSMLFTRVNLNKFKEEVDSFKLMQLIMWSAEGFMKDKINNQALDVDRINQEFTDILFMLKRLTYKEEYVDGSHRD